jgi:hypothetical protein
MKYVNILCMLHAGVGRLRDWYFYGSKHRGPEIEVFDPMEEPAALDAVATKVFRVSRSRHRIQLSMIEKERARQCSDCRNASLKNRSQEFPPGEHPRQRKHCAENWRSLVGGPKSVLIDLSCSFNRKRGKINACGTDGSQVDTPPLPCKFVRRLLASLCTDAASTKQCGRCAMTTNASNEQTSRARHLYETKHEGEGS